MSLTRNPCLMVLAFHGLAASQASARGHKTLVVYSTGGAVSPKIVDPLTGLDGEPSVRSGVDKFMGTDLEKILTSRGIRTAIAAGTSAHGAALYTASAGALRNLQTTVPIDGLSAESPFAEMYTVWHLKNAPGSISNNVTITRTDLITIH